MKTKIIQNIKSIIIILTFVIGVSYVSAAWTNPTEAPTGGNVPAPINVGGLTQTKDGPLQTCGLGILGDFKFLPTTVAAPLGVPPTSGQVLMADDTGLSLGKVKWAAVAGVTPVSRGIQVFDSNGTFTVPAGVTQVTVEVWGGGGAGGTGPGGGGGYAKGIYTVTPSSSHSVTVGSGSTVRGQTGGTSSFGSFISATGGSMTSSIVSNIIDGGGEGSGQINIKGGNEGDSPNGGFRGRSWFQNIGSNPVVFCRPGSVPGGGGPQNSISTENCSSGFEGARGRVVVSW